MYNYTFKFHDNGEPVETVDGYIPTRTMECSVAFPEDTTWHSALQEFARFLDSVGYAGVSDAVEGMLGVRAEYISNLFPKEEVHEDTSNT